MSRARLLVLGAVLVLLAGALVLGSRGGATTPAAAARPDLAALRSAAALQPCPAALSPALPDLTLPCVGNPGEVRLQGAPGRPTLVNVWATWCGPCAREVPLLQALHRRGRVAVVGVLTQDTVENGLRFAADPAVGGMGYPSVLDDSGTVMRRFGPGPPLSLFVTADGRVAHVKVGAFASRSELDGLVARYLAA